MFRTSVNLPGGDGRGDDGDDDVDHIDHVVHVDDVDVDVDHVDDDGQLAAEEDARILCRLEVLVVHGGRDERIFDLLWNFQSSHIQVLSGAHLLELAKQSLLFDIQHLEIFRSPYSRLHKIKATFESFRFSRTCQSLKVLLVTLSTLGWTHLLLSSVMSTCTWWRCASGLRASLSAFLSSFSKKVGIPETQARGRGHSVVRAFCNFTTDSNEHAVAFCCCKLIKIKGMVTKPLSNV